QEKVIHSRAWDVPRERIEMLIFKRKLDDMGSPRHFDAKHRNTRKGVVNNLCNQIPANFYSRVGIRCGNCGQSKDRSTDLPVLASQKIRLPCSSQNQTSEAPASKWSARFSLISASLFDGLKTSTQISGLRVRQIDCISAFRSALSQATSMAFTPSAVDSGHSVSACPSGRRFFNRYPISSWRLP